jgi:hypothetical protein
LPSGSGRDEYGYYQKDLARQRDAAGVIRYGHSADDQSDGDGRRFDDARLPFEQ